MIRFDKEHKDTVRIALNASLLQRLIGTGYYFYDDISVPLVKDGGNNPLVSMPKDDGMPLLSDYHMTPYPNSDDQELCRLWISLCSRLARNEQQYQHNHQKYLAVFLILWLVSITLLMILISDVYELPPVLFLLLPALLAVSTKWAFVCLPEKQGIYFAKALMIHQDNDAGLEQELYFQKIQSMVDDLAPSFADIGYTLDYVEDFRSNYPFLAHIRMTGGSSTDDDNGVLVKDLESRNAGGDEDDYVLVVDEATQSVSQSSHPSLSDRLRKFQWEAWEEHSGQLADQIQEQHHPQQNLQKSSRGTTLLGIPIQRIASCRTAILCASIPLGFFWVFLNWGIASYSRVHI